VVDVNNVGFTARLEVGLEVDSVNHLLYAIEVLPPLIIMLYPRWRMIRAPSWAAKQDMNTARGAPAVAVVKARFMRSVVKKKMGRDRLGGGIRSFEE
jgi:hypothetical protein